MTLNIPKEVIEKIVQNMVFRHEFNAITKDYLQTHFPEAISLSQKNKEDSITLYRVLGLTAGNTLREFGNGDSTSTSIRSCCQIADSMPSMIPYKDSIAFIKYHLFSFDVPKDRVLLDYDAILPTLKASAECHYTSTVYNKKGEAIPLMEAIELYEDASEKEVIADLSGLGYKQEEIPSPWGVMSLLRDFDDNEKKVRNNYLSNEKGSINFVKSVMGEKDRGKFDNWLSNLEEAPPPPKVLKKKRISRT